MDPVTATGVAFGAVPLVFDVFDRSVRRESSLNSFGRGQLSKTCPVFKFFSSMVDMPKDYERCRLQLMIEYNRLLAWGHAIGLLDSPNGSHIASSLGADAIELCSIISHIGSLLQKFKDINSRWKDDIQVHRIDDRGKMVEQAKVTNLTQQISSLSVVYDGNEEERERIRGTNHLVRLISRGAGTAKEIVAHPHRVRWVMVDKEASERLLKDLHSLTDRLHEWFSDHRQGRIHDITAKTLQEMVILRNELGEVKAMLDAVTDLLKLSTRPGTVNTIHNEHHETIRDLLQLKQIKCISDQALLYIANTAGFDIDQYLEDAISVSRYDGALFSEHITYSIAENTSPQPRPRGTLTAEGKDYEVWIEWRTMENVLDGSMEGKESRLRTAVLAQMLSKSKPRDLFAPTCLGLVDDRKQNSRFGWIFRMPEGSHKGTSLKSLHSMLGQRVSKPTLAQRISLSWKLASSLSHLHTANWLHKGIHSGSVIFCSENEECDIEHPILSGFEYSRPQSNKTTSRSLDPRWDIYRWPKIQNEAPTAAGSRKTYDIYSLGLVLLEIAHWEPLNKLMCLKRWPQPSGQDSRVRSWLLEQEPFPPFKNGNPLLELRKIAGDKYWNATKRCLVAHGERGMRIPEDYDQSQVAGVGIELQAAFNELVIEELRGISI